MQPSGHPAHSNLYVKGLPSELEQGELQQLFQIFGAIESCRIVRDMSTGASKGYGFVKFSTVQNAIDAIKGLNGSTLGSNQVEVKFADVDIGPAPLGKLHRSLAAAKGRVPFSVGGPSRCLDPAHGRSTFIQSAVDFDIGMWSGESSTLMHSGRSKSGLLVFLTRCEDSIRQPVRQKYASHLDRTGAGEQAAVGFCCQSLAFVTQTSHNHLVRGYRDTTL